MTLVKVTSWQENKWQLRNIGQQVGKNNSGDVELSNPNRREVASWRR